MFFVHPRKETRNFWGDRRFESPPMVPDLPSITVRIRDRVGLSLVHLAAHSFLLVLLVSNYGMAAGMSDRDDSVCKPAFV